MILDKTNNGKMGVLAFQYQFALAVCITLETRFDDNQVMTNFQKLGKTNIAMRQICLVQLGCCWIVVLCTQYDNERELEGSRSSLW